MAEEEPEIESGEENEVRIIFRVPARMPSVYATHFFVQETQDEFVLSFYELVHPMIHPNAPPEQQTIMKQAIKENGVFAECVSRITVAKHKLPSFAEAMNTASDRFVQSIEALEQEKENAND